MALSMDEQRVLAEIERRLAAEDPGLAACMTNFRRPGPAAVLRSPRARIIGSLFTVLLVAMISLMVYAMIPFRTHGTRTPTGHPGITGQTQLSAVGTGSPGHTGTAGTPAGASASAPAVVRHTGTNTTATGSTAAKTASKSANSVKPQVAKGKTSGTSASNR